jgi:hypothetical protein
MRAALTKSPTSPARASSPTSFGTPTSRARVSGPVAATLLASVLLDRRETPRQVAACVGLCPDEHRSGSSIRGRGRTEPLGPCVVALHLLPIVQTGALTFSTRNSGRSLETVGPRSDAKPGGIARFQTRPPSATRWLAGILGQAVHSCREDLPFLARRRHLEPQVPRLRRSCTAGPTRGSGVPAPPAPRHRSAWAAGTPRPGPRPAPDAPTSGPSTGEWAPGCRGHGSPLARPL